MPLYHHISGHETDPAGVRLTLKDLKQVHMIGIGGVGMSALAHILMKQGVGVSGSDRTESSLTHRLVREGAQIYIGHASSHVDQPDLVVYSAAVPPDNPERTAAVEKGIPQVDRAVLLGVVVREYDQSVSVAGSHGKTTTTAMLSMLLEWGGLDPTILVGGELEPIGGNVKVGKSPVLVTEACEYQASFLQFPTRIGLVLNIDLDHLDYFRDLPAIQAVFAQFARQLPPDGVLIMPATDANSRALANAATCRVISFGVEAPHAHLSAMDLEPEADGCWSFRLYQQGLDLGRMRLGIPGKHNVHNALGAIAVSLELGLHPDSLRPLLPRFTGIHRRFEQRGFWAGVTVIDDYAHHPAEITVTLEAARSILHQREIPGDSMAGRLICIFQPHTYTRTHALLKEFAATLATADLVVVTDIYAAREPDRNLVHSRDLTALIQQQGSGAVYAPSDQDAARVVGNAARPGDLVLTLGAGPVDQAIPFLQALLEKPKN